MTPPPQIHTPTPAAREAFLRAIYTKGWSFGMGEYASARHCIPQDGYLYFVLMNGAFYWNSKPDKRAILVNSPAHLVSYIERHAIPMNGGWAPPPPVDSTPQP